MSMFAFVLVSFALLFVPICTAQSLAQIALIRFSSEVTAFATADGALLCAPLHRQQRLLNNSGYREIVVSPTRWARRFHRLRRLNSNIAAGLAGLPADCALCWRKLRQLQSRHRQCFGEEPTLSTLVEQYAQWVRRWSPDRDEERESDSERRIARETDKEDREYLDLCDAWRVSRAPSVRLLLIDVERRDNDLPLSHNAETRLFKIRSDGSVTSRQKVVSSLDTEDMDLQSETPTDVDKEIEKDNDRERESDDEQVDTLWLSLLKTSGATAREWTQLSSSELRDKLKEIAPQCEFLSLTAD